MSKSHQHEIPLRSKWTMRQDVVRVIGYLHAGEREKADRLIEDLKTRSIYLDEKIQQDVLRFAEQVHFQYDYDPWHRVTVDVQKAADSLLDDL